jgi:hypothetical protein
VSVFEKGLFEKLTTILLTQVPHGDLNAFMDLAESLRVRGLRAFQHAEPPSPSSVTPDDEEELAADVKGGCSTGCGGDVNSNELVSGGGGPYLSTDAAGYGMGAQQVPGADSPPPSPPTYNGPSSPSGSQNAQNGRIRFVPGRKRASYGSEHKDRARGEGKSKRARRKVGLRNKHSQSQRL